VSGRHRRQREGRGNNLSSSAELVPYVIHIVRPWLPAYRTLKRVEPSSRCLIATSIYVHLAQHLHEHKIWRWAKEQYFEYRDIYLTILEYAAEGEIKAGRLRPDIQMECLLRAAHLYQRCALTAIKAVK